MQWAADGCQYCITDRKTWIERGPSKIMFTPVEKPDYVEKRLPKTIPAKVEET
jgi:hypothetical protein